MVSTIPKAIVEEMKPVLTTDQIKPLAESYNRRIYKEIQGAN